MIVCDALTKAGRLCRNREMYRTGRCWMHGASDRLNTAEEAFYELQEAKQWDDCEAAAVIRAAARDFMFRAAEAGDHPVAIGFERGAVRLLGAAQKLDDRAGGKS